MIGVTYSDYILLLLVCGNFSLTSKGGGCWNLLESTPANIPFIKSSHKWTQILFIISNSKLGIWLCSQPRLHLNSETQFLWCSNTSSNKYLSNSIYKSTYTKHIIHLVSPKYTTCEVYRRSQKLGKNRQQTGSLGPRKISSCDNHGGCTSGGDFFWYWNEVHKVGDSYGIYSRWGY